jgi:hypothetical protein
MDKVIFGDNQFFAINHMSEEKSRAQAMRFKDTDKIIEILDYVYDIGIRTFMCTTHDRISEICDHIRANPDKYEGFKIYPCMPYAHKYVNAVTELGVLGALKSFIPGSFLSTIAKGGVAVSAKDYITMMKLLVDFEMKMFNGIDTGVIFLQNIVTDLLLGLQMKEFFVAFADHVRKKYHAEPGFITMNLPGLLDCLDEAGIENPIVCSSINKIGFRMSGNKEVYETAFKERKFRGIAMQVFAAGAISPPAAINYVCGLENMQSILYGASTKAHILDTKNIIEANWRGDDMP